MKYIKTFEKKNLGYDIGDYVYVDGYPNVGNFCRISTINLNQRKFGSWDYMIDYFDESDNTYNFNQFGLHIDDDDIERLLTEDEILEFEAKIAGIKYNL